MFSLLCFTDISFGWMRAELEMSKDDLPTIAGSYQHAPLTITVGEQTFTVSMDKMGDKNNVASCIGKETGGITAKLDYDKCTFTISIKNADITQSGTVFWNQLFWSPAAAD